MKIGDKVKLYLDEEIKKAKKVKSYATPSVLELWEALNGREGEICKIEEQRIWVKGEMGIPRMFKAEVLKKVEKEDGRQP